MAQTASQSSQTEALQQRPAQQTEALHERLELQTEALQQRLAHQEAIHQETMSKLTDSMKTVPEATEKCAPKFKHFGKT